MRPSQIEPQIADVAPSESILMEYDKQHLIMYLRLLDADTEGAAWQEVVKIVLYVDPAREPERARRIWESHLARAKWMTENGYRHLLDSTASD